MMANKNHQKVRTHDPITPSRSRSFPLLLALALLTTQILQSGSAIDDRSAEEGRPLWTVNDTLKTVVMSDIDISPDASMLAYVVKRPVMKKDESRWQYQIFVSQCGRNNPFPLTERKSSSYNPKWSPDGRWIAFLSDRSGDDNIWIISAKGGEAVQVTDVDTEVLDFQWSTDAKTLSFLAPDPRSDKEEAAIKEKDDAQVKGQHIRMNHLWTVEWPGAIRSNSDGGYELTRITQGNFSVLDWDWSPDRKSIAFSHAPSPQPADEFFSDISTIDLETGKVTSLVESDAMENSPLYSPDGRWIAYTASDLPPADFSAFWVYLVAASTGQSRRLAETPDQKPHLLGWSEDGKTLYLWEYRNTTNVISALPADGSEPEDVSTQGGIMAEIRMNRAKTAIAFTFQNSSVPPEVYVSGFEFFSPKRVSSFNDDLPLHALGRTDIVRWNSSDGKKIEGLLTYPADYQPGVRYPLLLAIHGGPASTSSQDFIGGSTFYPMSYFYPYAAFSSQGYAILRPNPRGSGGYGAVFRKGIIRDWGGMDYRDLMAGVDCMEKMGVADPDRLGIMGWSYGGYLTAWTVTQTNRFGAASVGGGITDLVSMDGTSDLSDLVSAYLNGNFWDEYELYTDRSPIYHVMNATTPILIQHGAEDSLVPPTQGKELYSALVERAVPVEMVLYPRSGHEPEEPKLLRDVMSRNLEWFNKYLLQSMVSGDREYSLK